MAVSSGARGLEAVVVLSGEADRQRGRPLRGARPRRARRPGAPGGAQRHRGRLRRVLTRDRFPRQSSDPSVRVVSKQCCRHDVSCPCERSGGVGHARPCRAPVAGVVRRDPGRCPGAAGQAHLEPVPGPARVQAPGLDVSGLAGVIALDVAADGSATADVQGMCTYEDLVDVTLPRGLIPLVVPQLRSITLGGAVTGLGIESTSFRNGLPHESVLEMDVLTGDGRGGHAPRPGERPLRRVPQLLRLARLRHPAADRARAGPGLRRPAAPALRRPRRARQDRRGDRRAGRARRRPGRRRSTAWCSSRRRPTSRWRPGGTTGPSRSTRGRDDQRLHRDAAYFRSLQERETDTLTTYDYLWRWDTDWFWCSGAFGAAEPAGPPAVAAPLAAQRRLPPAGRPREPLRRRWPASTGARQAGARAGDPGHRGPGRAHGASSCAGSTSDVGMRPVWLCPLRASARPGRRTRSSRARPTSTSASGARSPIEPGAADGDKNRAVEAEVTALGGHKSLYSDAYYDRETFDRLYGVANQRRVEAADRPGQQAHGPLREGGEPSMTSTLNRADTQITIGEAMPG